MTDLYRHSGDELARGYAAGDFSPIEVTEACLARIAALNERFGAFALVDRDGAMQAAAASAERWRAGRSIGPADGIPTTIKDLVLTRGWPCRRGSHTTSTLPTAEDAPAVANLRKAGAVLLGSTTTPEFGWKAVTDNPLGQVARNPYDATRTAGGSSGGAAAAAALGMGAWHVGTDGGGSIRVPAGFCGLFGIKPTFGRVPARPLSPFGTVSHLGPICRTVADAANMLRVMSEPEPRDWHNLPAMPHDAFADLKDGISGLKVAVSADLGHLEIDPEIRAIFDRVVPNLTALGADVHFVDPPIPECQALFNAHWYAGAANLLGSIDKAHHHLIDRGLLDIAAAGAALDGKEMRAAAMQRSQLGEAMQAFLCDFDLLVTPTTAIPAFTAGLETPQDSGLSRWIEWAGLSYPFNLTQQPAATLRCGTTQEGLPVGLQLVSAKYREGMILRAAQALETAGLGFVWPDV